MDFTHVLLLSVLTTLLSIPTAGRHHGLPLPINLLRPTAGSGHHPINGLSCGSWRFAVETNNKRDWSIPAECEEYVGNYMLGNRYRQDSAAVVAEAVAYAEGIELSGYGKDVWVFDIDETSLSNVPFYAAHGFRVETIDYKEFNEWVIKGAAPALPESLKLYYKLVSLGIKVVFLTGRGEDWRNATILNLKEQGYHSWEKLLLRPTNATTSAVIFKSSERRKLVDEGYRIVGNIGDQWSDILGSPEGERTFKLPNPMYYVG